MWASGIKSETFSGFFPDLRPTTFEDIVRVSAKIPRATTSHSVSVDESEVKLVWLPLLKSDFIQRVMGEGCVFEDGVMVWVQPVDQV